MFVAVAKIPASPSALAKAASITGLALADVSRFLAGTLPRVLVRATSDGARLVAALEQEGFVAFAADESSIPSDKDRVVARNLELNDEGLTAIDAQNQRHERSFASITALLRGNRIVESSEIVKTTERKLDLGKALLTSGLSVTKKVTTVSEKTTSSKEGFILLQCGSALPGIMIPEHRFNYQCLGKAIQPSTLGNQMALLNRLKTLAPLVPVDDRITRPGFMTGLPTLSVDPVDLAIFLVSEARSRGC